MNKKPENTPTRDTEQKAGRLGDRTQDLPETSSATT